MDWYPWYPLDFRRDTLSLSLAEDGAYRRLIDEYMLRRGPLPNDDIALARILGVSLNDWNEVAVRVRAFFHSNPQNFLTHKRCDQEIRRQTLQFERHSARGQKAAIQRWSKNNGQHARRMHIPNTLTLERKKEPSLEASKSEALSGQARKEDRPFTKSLEEIVKAKGWTP